MRPYARILTMTMAAHNTPINTDNLVKSIVESYRPEESISVMSNELSAIITSMSRYKAHSNFDQVFRTTVS